MIGRLCKWTVMAAALLAAIGLTAPVSGAILASEDFEAFTADTPVTTTPTGHTPVWITNGQMESYNVVQDGTTANGTQALELVESTGDNSSSASTGLSAVSGKLHAAVDMMIPAAGGGAGISFTGSGSARLWISMTSNSFSIITGSNTVKNDSGETVKPAADTWYHVNALMNIDADDGGPVSTYTVTVTKLGENTVLGTAGGDIPNDPKSLTRIYLYTTNNHTGYYDNLVLETVPEPASATLLLGAGGLLLLRRRRLD